jgi:hypothetical protein
LRLSSIKKSDVIYKHIIEFNANVNDLKDWLFTYIPSLEYTYLDTNISNEKQSMIEDYNNMLEQIFLEFNNNTSIFQTN